MGYRSTLITCSYAVEFSKEFVDKYSDRYNFYNGNCLPISTKIEIKRYTDDIEDDLVKELVRLDFDLPVHAVWLHEDGKINRIEFTKYGVSDRNEYEDYS